MSKRTLLLLAALVAAGFTASATSAHATAAPAAPTVTATAPADLPADPLLGGTLATSVPRATFCADEGQCEYLANGTKCAAPKGCVCGWSGGQRACGRW